MSDPFLPAREPFHPVVLEACRKANPHSSPVMVPCLDSGFGPADCCHANAERVAQAYGGTVQRGWSVRAWEGVSVWLELHSVWRAPEGHLLCVTEPPFERLERLAFLPRSSMDATDSELPSVHFHWEDDPLCHEFVDLMYALDRIYFVTGDPLRTKDHVPSDQEDLLKARLREIARLRMTKMKRAQQVETRNPH